MREIMRKIFNFKSMCWGIIFGGGVLRIFSYASNHSIVLDEANLAIRFSEMSFMEIVQYSHYPIGYLLFQYNIVQLFTNNEYFLRLFPFICSIASLFLFYKVAQYYLTREAIPFALLLFSFSGQLIYYASEAKPYTSDMVTALLLLLVAIKMQEGKLTVRRGVFFSVMGIIALIFSYTAIFMLAGLGVSFIVLRIYQKEWRQASGFFLISLVWAIGFAFYYFLSLTTVIKNNLFLFNYWQLRFIPLLPTTFSDLQLIAQLFLSFFSSPLGIKFQGVGLLAFLLGCYALWLKRERTLLLLLSPVPFVILASGLQLYPFSGRLLLFLVPSFLFLIAEGVNFIVTRFTKNRVFIGVVCGIILVSHNVYSVGNQIATRYGVKEVKPVMEYINTQVRAGDFICLYHWAAAPFRYYESQYEGIHQVIEQRQFYCMIPHYDDWNQYWHQLTPLRGKKRVWMVFVGVYDQSGVDEEKLILYYLDNLGQRVRSFKTVGASVYLYDLSKKKKK